MNSTILILFSVITEKESWNISQTASFIASSEFKHRTTTSVVSWQADSDLLTDFLMNYQGSVKIANLNENQNQSLPFEQAVLIVTSSKEFLHFVSNLDKNIPRPSKVVTILVDPKELSNITEIAWKFDITDLIILILENQSVMMYTYYPYNINECGNTTPVKVEFARIFFPSKFKNLFGCQTRVGSIHSPPFTQMECVNGSSRFIRGIHGDLIMAVAEHLNTTVRVICIATTNPVYIAVLENKTIHVLTSVIYHHDFLAVQNAPVYQFVESVWCGPPRREIYAWAKVLVPLMSNITILLCATYFTLVFALKIIIKVERNTESTHTAWKVFAIILGQTSDYESKSLLQNLLFALWLWFSMVLTIAYQGVLVKGLQTKYLEPRFDKIENAMNLVDGFGGTLWQRRLYTNDSLVWQRYETKKLDEMFALLTPISRGKRFLILTPRTVLLGYGVQIFESVNRLPITLSMTPRWGASVEIALAHSRLVETGFFQKFHRDEELIVIRREAKLSSDSSDVQAGHLDFVTLSTCFYGLALMGLVCFLILLLELFYHRFTKNLRGEFLVQNVDKLHVS